MALLTIVLEGVIGKVKNVIEVVAAADKVAVEVAKVKNCKKHFVLQCCFWEGFFLPGTQSLLV